jgi:hypothetical protein
MSKKSKTPRTKSAVLENRGQRSEQGGSAAGENRPDKNNPQPRLRPPPAEETNRDHPVSPGVHGTVPGAGVVGGAADVYPDETKGGKRKGPGSGPCDAPMIAPDSTRGLINPPADTAFPEPGGISNELPGIADPNFPADKDRPENKDM